MMTYLVRAQVSYHHTQVKHIMLTKESKIRIKEEKKKKTFAAKNNSGKPNLQLRKSEKEKKKKRVMIKVHKKLQIHRVNACTQNPLRKRIIQNVFRSAVAITHSKGLLGIVCCVKTFIHLCQKRSR